MTATRLKPIAWAASLSILCVLWSTIAAATPQTSAPDSQAAADKSKSAKSESAAPSAQEIAAAKASHKVWVNLNTGIYHKRGRWYGKTKSGKFMTEDEAKKAGYKAAKRE
ncbi:MAG: hypothetical protein LAN83_19320 [Acidobacteriia bacterium]|nr:hypothetical protein [Terriglobia bacterium]